MQSIGAFVYAIARIIVGCVLVAGLGIGAFAALEFIRAALNAIDSEGQVLIVLILWFLGPLILLKLSEALKHIHLGSLIDAILALPITLIRLILDTLSVVVRVPVGIIRTPVRLLGAGVLWLRSVILMRITTAGAKRQIEDETTIAIAQVEQFDKLLQKQLRR